MFLALASWALIAGGAEEHNSGAGAQGTAAPLIDIMKDPGCGAKGLTPAQKIERNRRLAQVYFQAWVEGPARGHQIYGLDYHHCRAADGEVFVGAFHEHGRGTPKLSHRDVTKNLDTHEMEMYWRVMPDYAGVPGSSAIYAWEDGFLVRGSYGGHTKDGKWLEFWEVDIFRVNDEGKVVYTEFWNDIPGYQAVASAAGLGKITDLTHDKYQQAFEEAHEHAGGAAKQ